MNEDRALLENAAKAAGIDAECLLDFENNEYLHNWEDGCAWNPLTDDGDALRLAVKLKIGFKYHLNAPPEMGIPRECAVAVTDFGKWFAEVDRDEEKATRRAIVRAAAAIGEAM